MLVGGGSQTPALQQKIADMLNLPANRVAIRGIDAISNITFKDPSIKGPELVTPAGIAIAAEKSPVQYKTVYVNEQPIRLFEVNKLTIGDCLLASGLSLSKLYGKPGMAKIISLNGQKITIPGSHGEGPVIKRDGKICSLDDLVENGQSLQVFKGKDGEPTQVQIKSLIDLDNGRVVRINGKEYTIQPKLLCNGKAASHEAWIEDRDEINVLTVKTLQELLETLELNDYLEELRPYQIKINDKDTIIPAFSGKIFRNGLPSRLTHSFESADEILIEKRVIPTVTELAERRQMLLYQVLPVTFNGKKLTLTKQLAQVTRNGHTLKLDDKVPPYEKIQIEQKPFEGFLFQDLFAYVQIDIPQDKQGSFELLKNGEAATFLTPINKGDELSIVWKVPAT